ncbi:MAG: M28 family peptidase [Candidatus Thermoplasmatota archaeon]
MKHLAAAIFVLLLLAGCLSQNPSSQDDGARLAPLADRLAATVSPIVWDVEAQVDWWEDVATNYPKHDSNTPTNAMLRERIVADMEALGFAVEVRQYPGRIQGIDLPASDATDLHAIIATKPGTTNPTHRIGLVSHYDSQTATIHGAYDDLSGVAAEYSICKALAAVPMERTLACIFFDGEERGLVASEKYVDDVVVADDEGYVYDFVLGYDMTGLNWPGYDTWKMYVMVGENVIDPLYDFTARLMNQALGYPAEGVEVLDVHDRNSDERNFKEAGVPILRFAGGRHAADYDQYHKPLDTVEHVYELAGGRDKFEAGFATIVEASYVTTLVLDQTSLDEMLSSA